MVVLLSFCHSCDDRSISLSSKLPLMRSHVTSTILYACESWTLTAELQRRIQAMEMWCHRKILRISYTKTFLTWKSCQVPAGNRTTRRSPDRHKETYTAVVWTFLPFIRSCQNHLARHSETGRKTRQTEEVRRQHQEMERPGVRKVLEGSAEQRTMEETGCEVICGAPKTFEFKE